MWIFSRKYPNAATHSDEMRSKYQKTIKAHAFMTSAFFISHITVELKLRWSDQQSKIFQTASHLA